MQLLLTASLNNFFYFIGRAVCPAALSGSIHVKKNYFLLQLGLRLVPIFMLVSAIELEPLDIAIGAICFVSSGGLFYQEKISISGIEVSLVWPISGIIAVICILFMVYSVYS